MDFKSIIDKGLSGRYFLTIITGLVFAYATWKRVINADVVATIITMVFTLYFSRGDRNSIQPKGEQKP